MPIGTEVSASKLVRQLCLSALFASTLLLSACETSDEKAEKHYQSAIELIQNGDDARAKVELLNALKLNALHREARFEIAALLRRDGKIGESIGQYLKISEQYPGDHFANRTLAEIFAELGRWEEMESYLTAALEAEPEDQLTNALKIIFDYRNAIEEGENLVAVQAADSAAQMIEDFPDYVMLRQLVVDNHIRRSEFGSALRELDNAIEARPDVRNLYVVRLSVLGALEDGDGIEEQLIRMLEIFPDDDAVKQTLVRWYVSQGRIDDAEDNLRQAIDPETNDPAKRLTLLHFLAELRGQDVALREVQKMIDEGQTSPKLLSLKSGLEFAQGNREQAIADMRQLVETLSKGEELYQVKVGLAHMLNEDNKLEEARDLVQSVLKEAPTQVDALKLRAEWSIGDDRPGDAIADLRNALEATDDDAPILTMLAEAHSRDGNQELVGEMLSLAVEASKRAPEESLRYATYLSQLEKYRVAENVLIDALRIVPSNIALITQLGSTYIYLKEWQLAERVIASLRQFDEEQATYSANELQTRMYQAREQNAEAVAFLEGLAARGTTPFNANYAIVRTYLAGGEAEKAREYVDGLLEADSTQPDIRFLSAAIDATMGRYDEAETVYRELVSEHGDKVQIRVALYRMLYSQGKIAQADKVLEQAEADLPDDPTLLWIRASLLENEGDLLGAIGVYEKMYAKDSNNYIVANNLASLLANVSSDPEDIDRAYRIARRLRGSPVAPYRDTYGWLAFLRGELEEALEALAPAAATLWDDPQVQYHYARALAANGQNGEASLMYQRVIALVDEEDQRDFVVHSREEIERLRAELPVATEGQN